MSKEWFDRVLPYYVVAISEALDDWDRSGAPDEDFVHGRWTINVPAGVRYLLDDAELYASAIEVCQTYGLMSALVDEFGPDVYEIADDFEDTYARMKADYEPGAPLYRKFATGGRQWLASALKTISDTAPSAGAVKDADAVVEPKEWEPLPLDRQDPALNEVTAALDATIEAVRSDNGYSATQPEEQRFVLDSLRALRKRLAEDTQIAWMYVREFGIRPLTMVAERFGKAAVGIAAATATDALKTWLKQVGGEAIKFLFK